jgi:hypothetical protein
MTKLSTPLFAFLALASARVHADDLDVAAFEFIDVIETVDGSVLRGVVVEQEPGVKYKLATADGSQHVVQAAQVVRLTKARNKSYRGAVAHAGDADDESSIGVRATSSGLPRAVLASGARASFELGIAMGTGDIEILETSFAPTIRIGYESVMGNVGISGGVHGRFTYWSLPSADEGSAMWTLETHAYGQLGFHLGRAVPYLGVTFGPEINYGYVIATDLSTTSVGVGTNLHLGINVLATPSFLVGVGADYHPALSSLDLTNAGVRSEVDIEYFAFRFGAQLVL